MFAIDDVKLKISNIESRKFYNQAMQAEFDLSLGIGTG
jgi:hypothetical protein